MNDTPIQRTRMARAVLHRVLSKLLLNPPVNEAQETLENDIVNAMQQTSQSDLLVQKYYVDVREFMGFISAEYGKDTLTQWCDMLNHFKNSK